MKDRSEKFSSALSISSIILTTVGIIVLVFFLRNVDNGASTILLFSGSIILAAGNVLAFLSVAYHKASFFFVLFVTAFFLMTMYDIRFNVLQGTDIVWEYTSSKVTLESNTWALSRAATGDRYFTAASISLFPAIVSKITGLNLMPIFQWVMRGVLAILPLAIFQTVQEIFGDVRLSALSALIFVQFYYNFNLLNFLIRQGVAELFLVLIIYSLVKVYKGKNSLVYSALSVFSILGLVVSHYTMDYWTVMIFVGIFILCAVISYLPKELLSFFQFSNFKGEKQVINSVFLIFLICVSLFWIYFTNMLPFLTDIHNEIYLISTQIVHVPGAVAATTPTSSWFLNNPAGPVVGFWLDFTLVLIPVGFLCLLFTFRKEPIHMPWILGGFVMMLFVAIWVLAGTAMLGVYLDRVLAMGAPFFVTFIAASILLVNKKLLLNKKRVLRIFAIIIPIIFLMVNLPVNMIIPSYQRYVLYQPRDSVNPAVAINQNIIGVNEFATSVWLDQHASQNSTYWTDFTNQWFYASWNVSIGYSGTTPINNTGTYFLLDHYNLQFGMWEGPVSTLYFPVTNLLGNSSVVYSNGDSAIIAKTGS
jgi:uncharacterized membrane protein